MLPYSYYSYCRMAALRQFDALWKMAMWVGMRNIYGLTSLFTSLHTPIAHTHTVHILFFVCNPVSGL